MPHTVSSADGTSIEYDIAGDGPAIVLVAAALNLRGSNDDLAASLATAGYTVLNYDRRGRGGSTDAAPLAEYDLDRELEDLSAVLDEIGGRAALFGSSSGAAVCLYAAAQGLPVSSLSLWEIPLSTEPTNVGADMKQLRALIVAGDAEGALEFYMRDMPPEWLAGAKTSPYWEGMKSMAASLGYDLAALEWAQSAPLPQLLGSVQVPTQVLTGQETLPLFPAAAEALANAMPNARSATIAGAHHGWDTQALVAQLSGFVRPES
jgi:pimeloyl-ACP methyl ester carboxylesterase